MDLKEEALEYIASYSSDMLNLQLQREKALRQYMAEPYGNEEEGRSQVVTSDIFDTIETIMPYLMRLFYGGQDVAKFTGAGEGDDDGAELLGELVNWFVQKKMNGFVLFHDWIKSCLLERIAVVKYWYERRTDYKNRDFNDLTEIELHALMSNTVYVIDKVTAVEQLPETSDMFGNVIPAVMAYNVKARKKIEISQPMAEALASEEFGFDVKAKNITDCACYHKIRIHKSKLMSQYKMSEDAIHEGEKSFTDDPVYIQRFADIGGPIALIRDADTGYYYIHEVYLNEYGKKGEVRPKKIVMFGSTEILREDNSYGEPPFIELSPIRLPHRAIGLCPANILEDIQKIHTALYRAILDNIYFQNNAREAFDPSGVDVDTLIDGNVPGGKIPVKPGKDPRAVIFPLPVTPLAPQTYEMLKTIGETRQDRTGINRYVQGDDKGLNKTAFGVNTLLNQAMQRQELLARILAETGISKFFKKMAELTIEYMDQPQAIRLNGKWQTVNPSSIDVDYDINIDVGIATGSKDVTVQQMLNMLQVSLNPMLLQGGIVTPENIHSILKSVYENMGHKSVEQYITEPKPQMIPTGGMNVMGAQAGAGVPSQGVPTQGEPSQGIPGAPVGGGVF